MLPAINEIELDQEIVERQGLRGFVEVAWPEVQTCEFIPNWHIDIVCDHLEAQTNGELRWLVINFPPGCMKSLAVCVFWPVWEWGPRNKPDTKSIFASYGQRLSQRDAIRHRNMVDGPWFQARWPTCKIPFQNTRSAMDFANNKGGFRFSTTVKGGVTGQHANRIVVDDPTKPQDTIGSRGALATELENVIDWWDQVISTRQADPKTTTKTIIMQRLHERDLAGYVLDNDPDVVHLRLPMEYEPKHHCSTRIGSDPRTEPDELLWPERYPREEVDRLKRQLGSQGTASQLQQRPSPKGGRIFRRDWFQYWGHAASPHPQLPKRHTLIQVWDFTFKGESAGKKRSYTVGQVWAQSGANMFLVDQVRKQVEFVGALRMLYDLSKKWPKALWKGIEDKANGPAIYSAAKNKVTGMKLIPASGSKEERAQVAAVSFEAMNVWLPHKSIAPWIGDYEDEHLAFPMGANDDQVDCTGHALVKLTSGVARLYAAAMAELEQNA